jgi:hypothetical protein
MRTSLLIFACLAVFSWGCEQQSSPRAATAPVEVTEPDDGEVDTEALRKPGTGDYYRAVAGAKGTAERLKDKIGDYNRQVEEQADDVFDN